MRRMAPIAVAVLIGISVGCGHDNGVSDVGCNAHDGDEIAITHLNHGCVYDIDVKVPPSRSCAVLSGFTYDGYTLNLHIKFSANCCPEFITRAWADGNEIEIEVVDVLAGCRCICNYVNDFAFPWSSPGEVEIEFRSRPWEARAYACSLDTVIVLTE